MGLAMLVYVVLDGYDLGSESCWVFAAEAEKDAMVGVDRTVLGRQRTWWSSAIGLLLSGFPIAHRHHLGELYLPVAIMLLGLILRASLRFRMKGARRSERLVNGAFHAARWSRRSRKA